LLNIELARGVAGCQITWSIQKQSGRVRIYWPMQKKHLFYVTISARETYHYEHQAKEHISKNLE
jgi:hypothetical protein